MMNTLISVTKYKRIPLIDVGETEEDFEGLIAMYDVQPVNGILVNPILTNPEEIISVISDIMTQYPEMDDTTLEELILAKLNGLNLL